MAGTRARRTKGAAPTAVTTAALTGLALTGLGLAALTGLAGCSGNDSASSTVSEAESAARSVGKEATAAASSLASEASEASSALASATAEVGRKLDDIKGGANAKGSVGLGEPTTADDRTTVQVIAANSTDSTKSFAVQVDFTDQSGKLLDAVVVTVSDVPAGDSGKATARSNRQLTGKVRTEVARAVRY
ncbi:hypothetical protein ACFYRY_28995 [Streptomyces sp. NPDC005263]|uniref:hypothetical protein n=1 Tax=Streptomyces sp. NPDC005263 TaxID=3364711 RepID=UPI003682358A